MLKSGKDNLASRLTVDPIDFISKLVCSIKNYQCCDDDCNNCPNNLVVEVVDFLAKSDDMSYFKWVRKDGMMKKIEISDSGSAIAEHLEQMCGRKMKIHIYNIFRQYSELKYLKRNLCHHEC